MCIPEQVLFRDLEGESVLMHLGTGDYFGLDEVGTRIWHFLEEGRSLDQVVDGLLSEYEVQADEAERDVHRLVGELARNGLLVLEESEPSVPSENG